MIFKLTIAKLRALTEEASKKQLELKGYETKIKRNLWLHRKFFQTTGRYRFWAGAGTTYYMSMFFSFPVQHPAGGDEGQGTPTEQASSSWCSIL